MRVIGVLNRDGGTFKTMDLEAFARKAEVVFGDAGHELEVRVVAGRDLIRALRRAASEAELLLAGGGDGTVSAAAAAAQASGVPLLALPAGTMNLFARSLGIPLGLEAALAALASGVEQRVDIATANGRPFIHQFSVGIHPKLVRLREALTYRSRVGKMIASLRAAAGAMFNPPLFQAEIITPDGLERRRVAGISISNNPLDEGHLPLPDRLDRGVLGIYLMKPLTLTAMARLAFGLLRGKFRSLPEIIDKEAPEVTIRFPHWTPRARAVVDGELISLERSVVFKVLPGALRVMVPKLADAPVPVGRAAPIAV